MQKIVLFIESIDEAFLTPSKIANLFMNRLLIEEDVGSEILKILELKKRTWDEIWNEGMGLIVIGYKSLPMTHRFFRSYVGWFTGFEIFSSEYPSSWGLI